MFQLGQFDVFKSVCGGIKPIQSFTGTNPELFVFIHEHVVDAVVAERGWDVLPVFEPFEMVTNQTVQAILSIDPNKPVSVLIKTVDAAARQAMF